jgi:arsenite methyltransferase
MDSDKKKWVRDRYGAIAAGAQTGCCAKESCGTEAAESVAKEVGYREDDLAAVPDGANLGLWCGNPVAIAGIQEGEVVLDLGSGAGLDVFLAAERVGETGRVIGLDMTDEMIAAARKNAQVGGYTNVEFRQGDIENMPVEDDSIDLVISNCVLNLVPDKSKAFTEIFRVLKPGGRITVADIVLDGPLPSVLTQNPDAYCACISGAVSRLDYIKGLMDAGLASVKVQSEVDASDLLAGDCCGSGASLKGIVTSIKVTGTKPVPPCG